MTRDEARDIVAKAMENAHFRTNPRWHDVGAVKRSVANVPRGQMMQIACMEPFVSSHEWRGLHSLIREFEGRSSVCVKYVWLMGMAKVLDMTPAIEPVKETSDG